MRTNSGSDRGMRVRERGGGRRWREHRGEHPSEGTAIGSIAVKFAITRETLRRWVRRAEVEGGLRSGVTMVERELHPRPPKP
jgi:hypothetical protein